MAKERNIVLCIVFTIITCGIYGIYWFVKLTDETNELTGSEYAGGGLAFIFVIITGGIYGIYWAFRMGEKIDTIKGEDGGNSGILYLILDVLGLAIVVYALSQDTLNKAA